MANDNELLIRIRTILEGQGIRKTADELKQLVDQSKAASTEVGKTSRAIEQQAKAASKASFETGSFGDKLDGLAGFIRRRVISAFTGLIVAIIGVGSVIRAVANQPELIKLREAFAAAAGSLGAFIVRAGPARLIIDAMTGAFRTLNDTLLVLNPRLATQPTAFGEITRTAGNAEAAVRQLAEAEAELARQSGAASANLERQLSAIQQTESDEVNQLTADENLALARNAGVTDPVARAQGESAIRQRFGGLRRNARNRASIAQDETLRRGIEGAEGRAQDAVAEVPSLESLQRAEADFERHRALADEGRQNVRSLLQKKARLEQELPVLEAELAGFSNRRYRGSGERSAGDARRSRQQQKVDEARAEIARLGTQIGSTRQQVNTDREAARLIRGTAPGRFVPGDISAVDFFRQGETAAANEVTAQAQTINRFTQQRDDNQRGNASFNRTAATERQTQQVQGQSAVDQAQTEADRLAAEALNRALDAINSSGTSSANRIDSLGRALVTSQNDQDAAVARVTRAVERMRQQQRNNRP